jgi:hypothetical protein
MVNIGGRIWMAILLISFYDMNSKCLLEGITFNKTTLVSTQFKAMLKLKNKKIVENVH